MSLMRKIKLTVAGRVYPLTIDASQEASLRTSAKKIESTIKQFERNYAVRDKQDVLAMCVLQFVAQSEQKEMKKKTSLNFSDKKIQEFINMIDVHLATY